MIEGLKPAFNKAIKPAIGIFKRLGIRPNHLTVATVPVFAAAAWLIYAGHWRISLVPIVLGSLMDGWDGLLARETGSISRFGAILDSTCDRVTEILWLLGIFAFYLTRPAYGQIGPFLSFTAITGSLMVSYVKARAEGEGVACAKGTFQRPERLIFLAICVLAGPRIMVWGLGVLSVLTCFTVVQRLITAHANCKNR